MRVLLDEDLPIRLRHHFVESVEAITVDYQGWKGVQNGALLRKAVEADFDVFVTIDQGVPHQQNIEVLQIGVVVIEAVSNDIETLTSFMPEVNEAVQSVENGTVVRAKEPS